MTFINKKHLLVGVAVLVTVSSIYVARSASGDSTSTSSGTVVQNTSIPEVDLSPSQATQVKVTVVGEQVFVGRRDAVGNIAFNDDRTVQVYPPYAGKINAIMRDVGNDVHREDPLYSVDSPDLLQAESTLISAAGTLELTSRALERARALYNVQGIAQKDLQQAVSDQQSAEGAYKSAKDAVRIFGKTEAQIDQIVTSRHVDASLVVRSPIDGRIVTRNASPGTFAQPGTPPAPFSVADISVMWMLASMNESDAPFLKLGQAVQVSLLAYPGRVFDGKITNIGASVDPNTHRISVRSEVRDPNHELRSGMLGNFTILTGAPVKSPAVPPDSVVREGDGTLSVWVTTNSHQFYRREVTLGTQQEGMDQVLTGLKPGESVAAQGAIFLSHAYENEAH